MTPRSSTILSPVFSCYRIGAEVQLRTSHVVEPDVPADGVEGVVLPAHAHVPQPGLVVEDPQAVEEYDAVEEEPPALLAELGEGGGYTCSPLLTEPSLHLEQIAYVYKNVEGVPKKY